jgi:hypothetical protein
VHGAFLTPSFMQSLAKQANFKPVTVMHERGGVAEVLEDRDGQGRVE